MSYDEVLIGEVCSVGDGAHSKVKRIESGIPYLTSKNIGQGVLKLDKLDFISEESFEKLFPLNSKATRRPKQGDVLFGIIGTFGNAYLYKKEDHFGFSSSIGILRPDFEKINSEYLYYVVSSKLFKENHANHNAGSVQGYTNIPTVKSLPIPLPPINCQNKIAKILKSLDDKIQLNHQTNQTLESIAQAIFKSWFVDFDPVKAKITTLEAGGSQAEAEQAAMMAISAKSADELAQMQVDDPEAYQQLTETAALFPAKWVESELGLIPEGWEVKKLENIIELAYGKALKKTARIPGDYPVYGSGGATGTHCDFLVNGPGVIVGRKGTVGSIFWEDNDFYPIDTVFYIKPHKEMSLIFSYYLLNTLGLPSMNTDAAVPGLNRNNVYRLEISLSPPKLIDKFTQKVGVLKNAAKNKNDENIRLVELRDTLLPKLLSGEIDLSQLPTDEADP